MYDIAQPHYSGFLGFQTQLCSHYVIIVLNIVAHWIQDMPLWLQARC